MNRFIVRLLLLVAAPIASTVGALDAQTLYRIETLAAGLKAPWALVFLPDGALLITEKLGGVRLWRDGALAPDPVTGGPPVVLPKGERGLLDIALDPAFGETGWVFFTFGEGSDSANHTAVYRARWDARGGRFVDGRVIWRASPDKADNNHFGSRLMFLPDHTLLVTIGDGYFYRDEAQNLRSLLGKIVRLNRDGSIPASNPFRADSNARPEIYSYGHRNAQGLVRDSRDGAIWEHEHGPRGGDEINLLQPGRNYGWPAATYGIDYDGSVISNMREAPGLEGPKVIWVPSIAPSGFTLYLGDRFPEWRGISSSARSPNGICDGCVSRTAKPCCRKSCCRSSTSASATSGPAPTGCSTC